MLLGSDGARGLAAANELSEALVIPFTVYKIADDGDLIDLDNIWYDIYGITKNGAVMVRPDGHVSWRSNSAVDNPKVELKNVLLIYCDKYVNEDGN